MNILDGKTAFISGATGAIGKSIAYALAERGCNLFLTSTNNKSLEELIELLSQYEITVTAFSGDLTSKKDVSKIIDAAKIYKSIDILVNSAGVFPNINLFDTSDDDFENTLNINFRSAFMFTRAFAVEMVKNEWGRIVNIGSSSAYSGFQNTSVYCASKHALLGFSRAIHDELKENNVRTYFISPSSTKSKIGLETIGQDYSTFLDPEDIAKYVVFAISFDSNIMSEEIFLKRRIIR
jgi:short-subunit dehydrogenase